MHAETLALLTCGRHVESNQTRGNFIGVSMAEYEIEPLKVL
jgi:hypothetical protein